MFQWTNGPRNERSRVPWNESSRERTVQGTNGPWTIRSRERKFHHGNVRIVLGTNSLENECSIILRGHYDDERYKIMFPHDTRTARPRPIFWSETGLVLRPTVSDHITGIAHVFSMFDEYNGELFRKIQSSVHC